MQPINNRPFDYPTGPDGYSNLNASNNDEIDLFSIEDKELIEKLDLMSDEELEKISNQDLKKEYKKLRFKSARDAKIIQQNDKKVEKIILTSNAALAQATSNMAVRNIATVRQNMNEVRELNTGTKALISLRTFSLLCTIGTIVFTILCILL